MNELNWHPPGNDPAFRAGYEFVERQQPDGSSGGSPWWHGWMVRQAFWAGVKWERDNRSLPVLGTIVEGGKVTWREEP